MKPASKRDGFTQDSLTEFFETTELGVRKVPRIPENLRA